MTTIKKCAYCGGTGPFTNEHVVPAFLYRACRNQKTMYHPTIDEYIRTEVKIGDVCGKCNSGPLSNLDAYGKAFLEKSEYLKSFTSGQIVRVDYDYTRLLQWLLKLSYNSARAMNKPSGVLEACSEFILGHGVLPYNTGMMVEVISEPDHSSLAEIDRDRLANDGASLSHWFRFGRFGTSISDVLPVETRFVVLNAFHFYVVLFPPDVARKQRRDWRTALKTEWPCVTVMSPGRSALTVRVSNKTSFDTLDRDQALLQMPAWHRHMDHK